MNDSDICIVSAPKDRLRRNIPRGDCNILPFDPSLRSTSKMKPARRNLRKSSSSNSSNEQVPEKRLKQDEEEEEEPRNGEKVQKKHAVKSTGHSSEITLVRYPVDSGRQGIGLVSTDIDTLRKSEYLNDAVIDFWLQYMFHEKLTDEDRQKTHIFSIYFYNFLCRSKSKDRTKRENRKSMHRNWTKGINIFEKDFVFVPISLDDHWFMAVICFPYIVSNGTRLATAEEASELKKRPCILIFDSMPKYIRSKAPVYRRLWEFLTAELKRQEPDKDITFTAATMPACVVQAPEQYNRSDCGLYLFKCFEHFFADPIKNYEFPIASMKTWFSRKHIQEMRRDIYHEVISLTTKHFPQNSNLIPTIHEFAESEEDTEGNDSDF